MSDPFAVVTKITMVPGSSPQVLGKIEVFVIRVGLGVCHGL